MLVVHVFGFIAIVVVLWVMGDKTDPGSIFTEFSDPQGWGSVSISSDCRITPFADVSISCSTVWLCSSDQLRVLAPRLVIIKLFLPLPALIFIQIGSDSSVHLGEELREAAWVLPRSMVTSAAVNYTLAFLMLISKSTTTKESRPLSR